jgi:hypothetical protein
MFLRNKPLMQQADAAGGSTSQQTTGSSSSAAGDKGAAGDKTGTQQQAGQQQTQSTTTTQQGKTDAAASQGQTQQQQSQNGKPTDATSTSQNTATKADIAIKLPDGAKADAKFLDAFTGKAKVLGFSQDQAQGMAEFLMDAQQQGIKALEDGLKAQVAKEAEALRADKDFGGSNYDKTVKARDIAFERFSNKEVAEKWRKDGVISVTDPEFVKMCARFSALTSEDTVGDKGAKPGASVRTREDELRQQFPNSYDQMVGKQKTA